jgi:putative Holliday junction resolvase
MGIDYGQKRIGVAISDSAGNIASPLTVLSATGRLADDAASVVALADRHEVERFVVGLPINMDATEGPQAKLTRTFAGELKSLSGRPVDLHDERLSSWAADRAFDEAQLTRKQRNARRDAVAAQIILQGYLDRME